MSYSIAYLWLLSIPLFLLGVVLLIWKKGRTAGRVILTPFILAGAAFAGIIGTLIATFGNVHGDVYSVFIMLFSALVAIALICTLWGAIKKKKVYIPIISVAVVLAIVTVSVSGYYHYHDNIPKIIESADSLLYDYAPYNDKAKTARLEEESTLLLTEDLPVMDGATALYPVYSSFVKAVYPKHRLKGYTDDQYLKCSTTTWAYQNIVTGEADIIFVAGPSEEQEEYAVENGVELVYTPIGREAFVFFVNSQNSLEDITVEEVQGIYSGEITRWSDLGVEGLGKIRAFQRNEGSGSQSALLRLMGDIPVMEPPTEDVVDAMMGIITKTSDYKNYKNAIGYSFRFYSTEMVQNDQIKLLSINGVAPTLENIENGTYPIASEFYAVTRKGSGENVQKLLEWILGPQGQKLIELTGYTPIK